jgi:mannose-6-phosphate isomerase-like protein (cupin superfamily)
MATTPIRPPASAVRYGAELTFETLAEGPAPVRRREAEDTLLRVIDGMVLLAIDGSERLLETGDEAIVPAGAAHRLSSACARARIVVGFRAV